MNQTQKHVEIGNVTLGNDRPLTVIAGPCQLENLDHALMIGETILGRQSIGRQLAAPFVGSIIYYQLISLCLAAGLAPSDLKIATGAFVLLMLGLPILRKQGRSGRLAADRIRE